MQYAMQVFEYEDNDEFRVIDRNGEPWFILTDVAKRLGIGNPSDAASRLDDDEKGVATIDTLGGKQAVRIINESGLYSLILTSRKPEAKRFKKWVTSEVLPTIRKTGGYHGKIPAFIRRYNANWDRVDNGYFSVISELTIRLWGRLEQVGHIMADKAPNGCENRPDVSVGRLFSDWLKKNHPKLATMHKMYIHVTPEWEGEARQYPNSLLHLFIEFVDTVWIPEHSERYFNTRDPAALPYLPRLLPKPGKALPGKAA
jgi:prophage antirepressor-like protein